MECFEQHMMQGNAQSSWFASGLSEGSVRAEIRPCRSSSPWLSKEGHQGISLSPPTPHQGFRAAALQFIVLLLQKRDINSGFASPQIFRQWGSASQEQHILNKPRKHKNLPTEQKLFKVVLRDTATAHPNLVWLLQQNAFKLIMILTETANEQLNSYSSKGHRLELQ